MASNIEIKARSKDFANQKKLAEKISGGTPELLIQEDIFFRVPHGRLKLRILGPNQGELIAYSRPDQPVIKHSTYEIFRTTYPERLRITLGSALPVECTVLKRRSLYHIGQSRMHFDQVEGLGEFIELEFVLEEDQPPTEGHAIVQQLMIDLGIREEDLIDVAYADLLTETRPTSNKARAATVKRGLS
jgi:adenylate cyclase class IV